MRRSWTGTLLTCCLVGVSACGGSSGDDDPAAASESAPATTRAAASASPTGPTAPTEATLKKALLTVQDMPTGWKAGVPDPDDEDDTDAGGDCGAKLEAFDDKYGDAEATATAKFEQEADEIEEELKAYADSADLEAQFTEYVGIIRSCRELILDTGDEKVSLTVAELSLPKMGDESFAYSATGKVQGITIALNFALVRSGLVFVQLSQAGVFSADAEVLADTTSKALAKLDTVTG